MYIYKEKIKLWKKLSACLVFMFMQVKGVTKSDNINARLIALIKKMEELELKKTKAVHEMEVLCVVCETNGHMIEDCPTIPAFKEVLYAQVSGS